ncbi:MAG: winged helix-turn-helix domain-containing protein [Candidatus Aenigmarchaeota archaeon]|nr:winged helix-turn-helix domain-containing protein [Candidatus Aenigmarchaeota archaeon]
MKKRARIEIVCDILFFIKGEDKGAKPTHILYKANLSPKLLKRYLGMLLHDGLIKKVKENKKIRYRITKRGIEFLNRAKSLEKICSIIHLIPYKRKTFS